jgi:hypothetical protein
MRSRRHHLGIGFEVWGARDDQPSWFWLVVDSRRSGGTIGSAATEADAISDACASIEEISSQRWADLAASPATPQVHRGDSIARAAWKGSLASLERYLAGLNDAAS